MIGLSKKKIVNDVSFNVRKGEIVTLAGIDGNGQQEVIYGITGIKKTQSGTITLNGKDISSFSVRERNKTGISHIPEDRHKHGLVLDYSIYENAILDQYYELFPDKRPDGIYVNTMFEEYIDHFIKQGYRKELLPSGAYFLTKTSDEKE